MEEKKLAAYTFSKNSPFITIVVEMIGKWEFLELKFGKILEIILQNIHSMHWIRAENPVQRFHECWNAENKRITGRNKLVHVS